MPDTEGFWLTVVDSRRLRQLRRERRLTQIDLADRSGISVATISKLEKARARCRDSTIAALASALDVPVAILRHVTDPAYAGFRLLTPHASRNGTGARGG